eukprot:5269568-Prymnesium_polylepis.1
MASAREPTRARAHAHETRPRLKLLTNRTSSPCERPRAAGTARSVLSCPVPCAFPALFLRFQPFSRPTGPALPSQ